VRILGRAAGRGRTPARELPKPARDEVVVRTLYSGVSRGTEALVFRAVVPPESQCATMRAPFQDGERVKKSGWAYVSEVREGWQDDGGPHDPR
jgi:hypothetical protein